MTLAENLAVLESSVSDLKVERALGALQNDVYEAMDDLRHLGQHAITNDTRINYPVRAASDLELFRRLREIVSARAPGDRERYLPLLDAADNLLRQIAQISVPKDGHLRVLGILRSRFDFLLSDYGFTVTDERPTSICLRRGAVVVELGYAPQSRLSFSMSKSDLGDFWLDDLLFLHGDQRYRSVPQTISLNTELDVDDWFQFISEVLRQYGDELLRDKPGAFDQLAHAQTQRDAEYVAEMNTKHGQK